MGPCGSKNDQPINQDRTGRTQPEQRDHNRGGSG